MNEQCSKIVELIVNAGDFTTKQIECIANGVNYFTQQPVNLTPRQAAKRLNVAEQTLANWRTARRGPDYRKFGSVIRYPVENIEAFEKNSTITLN